MAALDFSSTLEPRSSNARKSRFERPIRYLLIGVIGFSASLMNIFFEWSAGGFSFLPVRWQYPTWLAVTNFANAQIQFFGLQSYFQSMSNSICGLQTTIQEERKICINGVCAYYNVTVQPYVGCVVSARLFVDYEVLFLIGALALASFLLYRKKGIVLATLKAIQITSLTMIPLGVEVALFDWKEFFLHASLAFQILTNADVLLMSAAAFVAATIFLRRNFSVHSF
jgi:hypothetical protein